MIHGWHWECLGFSKRFFVIGQSTSIPLVFPEGPIRVKLYASCWGHTCEQTWLHSAFMELEVTEKHKVQVELQK